MKRNDSIVRIGMALWWSLLEGDMVPVRSRGFHTARIEMIHRRMNESKCMGSESVGDERRRKWMKGSL